MMDDDRRGGGQSRGAGDDERAGADRPERDFGDSAGYGGGGSALDHDEVLGDEGSRRDVKRPNPLDAVVHTEQSDDDRRSEAVRTEDLAGPHAKPSLTNEDATPGAGALPSEPTSGDVDPGVG